MLSLAYKKHIGMPLAMPIASHIVMLLVMPLARHLTTSLGRTPAVYLAILSDSILRMHLAMSMFNTSLPRPS